MKDKIITLETAKLAKETGFNYPVPHCYLHDYDFETDKYEYIISLFEYFLGSNGTSYEIYENVKNINFFNINCIQNENETYFDYNQDMRKILARIYNGEEWMNDPKSYNMNVDSFTYNNWTDDEKENNKILLPNYNDGDFDFTVYKDTISAPTQSMLQKYLREVHNVDIQISIVKPDYGAYHVEIYIQPDISNEYTYFFIKEDDNIYIKHFESYEEALEEALIQSLKRINI